MQRNRRLVRRALLSGTLSLALTLLGGHAEAVVPYRTTFDSGPVSFVDHDVCAAAPWGFDVTGVQHEYGFLEVFFDGAGNVTRINVHIDYDATLSANGITLREHDTWNNHFAADGSVVATGRTVHIQGPGGLVLRDAGRILIAPDGNVTGFDGPHPQLSGATFCPALVP